MSLIFLDTVGLLALWDIRDQWHDAAEAAFRGHVASGEIITTSYFCWNAAILRRAGLIGGMLISYASRWRWRGWSYIRNWKTGAKRGNFIHPATSEDLALLITSHSL